jgi:hypothetical protein
MPRRSYKIIERYGLEEMIKEAKKDGKTVSYITEKCNELLPKKDQISKRVIEYFLEREKNKEMKTEITQSSILIKLNKIEEEVWGLIEEAKSLNEVAKEQLHSDPVLFDRSLRTLNQILNTAISLVKELKAPAQSLNINFRQESLQVLMDFSNSLPSDIKRIIAENIEKYLKEKN